MTAFARGALLPVVIYRKVLNKQWLWGRVWPDFALTHQIALQFTTIGAALHQCIFAAVGRTMQKPLSETGQQMQQRHTRHSKSSIKQALSKLFYGTSYLLA